MRKVAEEIRVDLGDIIDHDLEGFLNLIAEKAGYPLLMDIDYRVVSVDSNGITLRLSVAGEVDEEDMEPEALGIGA